MTNRIVQVFADGGPAGFTVLGQPRSLWAARGLESAYNDEGGPFLQLTTPGGAGTSASIESGEQWLCRGFQDVVSITLKTGSDVTSVRLVAGCSDVSGAKLQAPIANMAAFVYDTVAHGTAYWRAVTSDGSGTLTTTATTQAIAADTFYTLVIAFGTWGGGTGDINFFASQAALSRPQLVAEHTTNLPAKTARMRAGVWLAQI